MIFMICFNLKFIEVRYKRFYTVTLPENILVDKKFYQSLNLSVKNSKYTDIKFESCIKNGMGYNETKIQ